MPGATRRSSAPRWSTRNVVQLLEAEIKASGRNRVQLNRRHGAAAARPPRAHAGDGVRARRPPAGEGRAGEPARLPRRPPRRRSPRVRRRRGPTTNACSGNATPCCGAGIRGEDAVGTLDVFDLQLAGGRRRARPGPGEAARTTGPGGGRRVRGARRRPHPDHHDVRGGVGVRRARRGLVSTATCRLRSSTRRVAPQGRGRPRRHAGRAAPRRVAPARRRDREPHPRVAGRAAHARARAAPRRAPPVRRAHRHATGAAARRRVQRARRPAARPRSSRTSTRARRWSRPRARCRRGMHADRMLRVDAGQVRKPRDRATLRG